MNDHKMKELSEKYGTPLYVYDSELIENTYFKMKSLLWNKFDIYFSVKSNPSLGICQLLKELGSGIEVASAGELLLALRAGFDVTKILFSGPGKTYEELELAAEKGIAAIIVESIQELTVLESIARQNDRNISIGIRINPLFGTEEKNPIISMMGGGTQFGISQDELQDAISIIKKSKHLKLICFHIYPGSQICDYKMASKYFEESIRLLKNYIVRNNLEIEILDFGGGFGISYDGKTNPFDFYSFSQEVRTIYNKYKNFLAGKRLVFESGRFLLAESGLYLTKILYRKRINQHDFLITDGGMNQNAISTYRGKRMRSNFVMHLLNNVNEQERVTVAGPLCTPDDIIGRNVSLSRGKPGDILCVHNSGAYGSSFSPVNFLGHPTPCEILLRNGREYILKQRGDFGDILVNNNGII